MLAVWLGVTTVISALFWERSSQKLWKTSVAFLLCVAQFCQKKVQRSCQMSDQIKYSWCLLMLGLVSQRK